MGLRFFFLIIGLFLAAIAFVIFLEGLSAVSTIFRMT